MKGGRASWSQIPIFIDQIPILMNISKSPSCLIFVLLKLGPWGLWYMIWGWCFPRMMVEMKCRPLAERRRLNRIVFMYKVLKGYVAVPMDRVDLILNPWPPRLGKTKKQLKHLARKTPQYEHSFASRTIIQWNALPNSVTASVSVPSFRDAVAAHQAPSDHSGCTQILPRYPLEIVNHKTRQAHYFFPSLLPSASPYCPYSPNIIFPKLFGNSIVG